MIVVKPPAGSLALRTEPPRVEVATPFYTWGTASIPEVTTVTATTTNIRGPPRHGLTYRNSSGYQSDALVAVSRGGLPWTG